MHEINFTWKILSHSDINTDKYLMIDLLNIGKILIRFFVFLLSSVRMTQWFEKWPQVSKSSPCEYWSVGSQTGRTDPAGNLAGVRERGKAFSIHKAGLQWNQNA